MVISESKPHQDVLNEENIKIEAITEVKGVQGNWKLVQLVYALYLVRYKVLSCLTRNVPAWGLVYFH